jgi:hypothetical protein
MKDDELGRTYCNLSEIINAYNILVGKSHGKRFYGKT